MPGQQMRRSALVGWSVCLSVCLPLCVPAFLSVGLSVYLDLSGPTGLTGLSETSWIYLDSRKRSQSAWVNLNLTDSIWFYLAKSIYPNLGDGHVAGIFVLCLYTMMCMVALLMIFPTCILYSYAHSRPSMDVESSGTPIRPILQAVSIFANPSPGDID